jgi:hypothetical protein
VPQRLLVLQQLLVPQRLRVPQQLQVPQEYLELQRHRIVLMYQVLQEQQQFLPVLYFLLEFLGRQAVGHLEIGELARMAAEALPLEVVLLPLEEASLLWKAPAVG